MDAARRDAARSASGRGRARPARGRLLRELGAQVRRDQAVDHTQPAAAAAAPAQSERRRRVPAAAHARAHTHRLRALVLQLLPQAAALERGPDTSAAGALCRRRRSSAARGH